MAEQTLNIPQLVVFAVITVLAIRWFFAKKPASQTAPPSGGLRPLSLAQVAQLAQMFPQLDRRHLAYDLLRNGGNMAATTERILSGRGLEVPPSTFNPALPASTPAPSATTSAKKPTSPDLITRYNLSSKVNAAAQTAPDSAKPNKKAWSQDRNERQANLQRRRDEMILAARRKMEEKERAKATGSYA